MFGDDSWMDIIDPAIDVAGYGLKLPVGQARITIGQLIDYINSDDADFDLMSLFLRRRERDRGTRERPTFYGEENF
jgi:gamma-glutamyltranspeptidase